MCKACRQTFSQTGSYLAKHEIWPLAKLPKEDIFLVLAQKITVAADFSLIRASNVLTPIVCSLKENRALQ